MTFDFFSLHSISIHFYWSYQFSWHNIPLLISLAFHFYKIFLCSNCIIASGHFISKQYYYSQLAKNWKLVSRSQKQGGFRILRGRVANHAGGGGEAQDFVKKKFPKSKLHETPNESTNEEIRRVCSRSFHGNRRSHFPGNRAHPSLDISVVKLHTAELSKTTLFYVDFFFFLVGIPG